MSKATISIIIPTRDQFALLNQCINSLYTQTDYSHSSLDIIVVNNQSECPETLQYLSVLSSLNAIRVINYNAPFNFSAMNNAAVQQAEGDFICLLNNDIEAINSNWLNEMISHAVKEETGCVGAKLYYPDDTIQHAGVVLGINNVAGHVYKHCSRDATGHNNHLLSVRNYSAVTAACLLVKKSIYQEVGGFDEKLAVAYNDVDFCLKVGAAGYRHVWTPHAELYHHESKSRGTHKQRSRKEQRRFKKEVRYMKKKWGDRLKNDPAWHPDWPLVENWCGEL